MLNAVRFRDRTDAGQALARQLQGLVQGDDIVVLGLPRGGVPVAFAVASALSAPLSAFVVRKVGVPGHEELAMGAIASGGTVILNERLIRDLGIGKAQLEGAIAAELRELRRREAVYDGSRGPLELAGRTVILVDDGLATGSTMLAAVAAVRRHNPKRVVVAIPVAPEATCARLRAEADQVVCTLTPDDFVAVGQWYEDFSPTTDAEVREVLDRAAGPGAPAARPDLREAAVIPVDGGRLEGDLVIPEDAAGVVLFAHGSGSSRFSPRNRQVAAGLNRAGLGTLLLDLLTPEQEQADRRTGRYRFDIDLLSRRLVDAIDWLESNPAAPRPVGLFGASTGAAAALVAAAERPGRVRAVVSRGGRPDLADQSLPAVRSPTLLVVGGADTEVLELNRRALARLRCAKQLAVVPGATHLFEEPGALDQVTELAAGWFSTNLAGDVAS